MGGQGATARSATITDVMLEEKERVDRNQRRPASRRSSIPIGKTIVHVNLS